MSKPSRTGNVSSISAASSCGPFQAVHWLENKDGDSAIVTTACGRYHWQAFRGAGPLDPSRKAINPVTCLRCLEVLADREIEKIAAGAT